MKLNICKSPTDTAYALIHHILKELADEPDKIFHIAFSGGETPMLMYDIWAHDFAEVTPWKRIRFWWVDERCVPPSNSESNYGQMKRILLDVVGIPEHHIFRIHGESDPVREAVRCSEQVMKHVPVDNYLPLFDLVLLGVGEDGHTSSIFPGQEALLSSHAIYETSTHPCTRQKRIALTGAPIINAREVIFLITGKDKASVVKELYSSGDTIPAAYIARRAQQVELYLDEAAAVNLEQKIR